MGRITGLERREEVPPKVLLMYEAVGRLIEENVDINDIRVSTITDRAGIGKGTAYDYFDTKEEILACAITFYMRTAVEKLEHMVFSRECFADRVALLLEEIDKGSDKQHCMMRYIHMMTDTSGFSRLVQEKINKEDIKNLPTGVFATMVKHAKNRGEVREDLPVEYMAYELFSRIISYMICVGKGSLMGLEADRIRPFVYQSILDELCEKKA